MNIRFESEIDVYFLNGCVKHIGTLPLEKINPMVGDMVQIYHDTELNLFYHDTELNLFYHDTELNLYMKVKSRKWKMMNGTPECLVVTLTCPDEYSPESFIGFLRLMRFPI